MQSVKSYVGSLINVKEISNLRNTLAIIFALLMTPPRIVDSLNIFSAMLQITYRSSCEFIYNELVNSCMLSSECKEINSVLFKMN